MRRRTSFASKTTIIPNAEAEEWIGEEGGKGQNRGALMQTHNTVSPRRRREQRRPPTSHYQREKGRENWGRLLLSTKHPFSLPQSTIQRHEEKTPLLFPTFLRKRERANPPPPQKNKRPRKKSCCIFLQTPTKKSPPCRQTVRAPWFHTKKTVAVVIFAPEQKKTINGESWEIVRAESPLPVGPLGAAARQESF